VGGSAMTQNRLDTLKHIRSSLELILGIEGYNVLGLYEVLKNGVVISTIPAIKIRYPQQKENIATRMKINSGIECTIESEPQIVNLPVKFGYIFHRYFQVILDQHNELGDLTTAVEAVISSNYFDISESPVIRSAVKNESGVIPPRALLFLRQAQFVSNLSSF
jgi:hypothetical protein